MSVIWGVTRRRPIMVCFTFQYHITRLISPTSLAQQPGLVVAKMRSSCATIRPPSLLRTVSGIHYLSSGGHSSVPVLVSPPNCMPEHFSFPLPRQRDTLTPILIFSFSSFYACCDVAFILPPLPTPHSRSIGGICIRVVSFLARLYSMQVVCEGHIINIVLRAKSGSVSSITKPRMFIIRRLL